jgi:hypothetical protein
MAINLYNVHDAERREATHAEYTSAPEFAALERKAAQRGYRHAALGEINASAMSAPWAIELFCWRGGLWARAA